MNEPTERRPGDIILDRYVPDLAPGEREEARAQLYRFVAWQMRIIMRQVCEAAEDSLEKQARATLD